ncbi:MAG: CarD family transcriptional regulator [Oscillospiraceae bacterium]|nr:CarD family transcriptional regulator [Oscillospiraceae bacterium]
MFNVGDKIVYPMHGAGIIESIEEKDVLGEKQDYYIVNMPGEVKVMVPTARAQEIGVRDIIGKEKVSEVIKVLEENRTETEMNWNKRYRNNMDRMKSGDIYEVADIVRNLSHKQKSRSLSTGEKKMLLNAKQILVSEIVLADQMDKDAVEELVDSKIDMSYINYVGNSNEDLGTNVVSTFIPYDA